MPETRQVAIVGAGIGASHFKGYMALPDRSGLPQSAIWIPTAYARSSATSPTSR